MSNHLGPSSLWLIGTGAMALEYCRVLEAQNIDFQVIGRGKASAMRFAEATGRAPIVGGIPVDLGKKQIDVPKSAIVAVSVEQLAPVTLKLISLGVQRILVEKPAGLNAGELTELDRTARASGAEIYVAYNRRFYASTLAARKLITEDGGVKSFTFDFTERSRIIEGISRPPAVKQQWFLANSSHVIDLAFFLCGKVREISCYSTGGLQWHPSASRFVGAGVTDRGVPFSYHANWESPGGWRLEILTSNYRLLFSPLEKLKLQTREASVPIEMEIDDRLDTLFKPGLFKQVVAFLEGDGDNYLCELRDHVETVLNVYSRMNPKSMGFN